MKYRPPAALLSAVVFALLAGPVTADGQDANGWRSNWNGNSFTGPPPPQAPTNDLAVAMRNASLARSELEAATANLTAVRARVRADFENSDQLVSARRELADARQAYDEACAPVVAAVQENANYRAMIEKRTEVEIELRAATNRAIREQLAAGKLNYSAQAQLMLSEALARDANVQNSKARLQRARDALSDLRTRFEAEYPDRPEILAAQKSVEQARANLEAANAYLNGVLVTRSDTLDAAGAGGGGGGGYYNNPYWGGFPYGYYGYGFGPFFGGGLIVIHGHGHR
jgi:hypothetical protein